MAVLLILKIWNYDAGINQQQTAVDCVYFLCYYIRDMME